MRHRKLGRRPAACAGVLAALMLPAGAGAGTSATYYVNQSNPAAWNYRVINGQQFYNHCLNPDVPCLSILYAEAIADGGAGNTVRVLPDPSGETDSYTGNLELGDPDADNHPVILVGAGSGPGGTRIVGSAQGHALRLIDDSRARDLAVNQPHDNSLAIVDTGYGVVERVVAGAPSGTGYAGGYGTLLDSTVQGRVGGSVGGGVAARAVFIGSQIGVDVGADAGGPPSRLLDSIVASSGGAPNSVGIRSDIGAATIH